MELLGSAVFLMLSAALVNGGSIGVSDNEDVLALFKRSTSDDNFSANDFLEKFGYLDVLSDDNTQHDESERTRAVREFQRFAGLPPSGILDVRTANKMKQPRCGVPDVIKPSQRRVGEIAEEYNARGQKWDHTDVTYKIMGWTGDLGGEQQRLAYYKAFRKWSDVTPLTFREVNSGKADILLNYGRYNHGDRYPFDGRSGTLAHAFFPSSSDIGGDTHFDEDETWSVDSTEGTNLEVVAAHEFGHALGLSHSSVQSALMAPFYKGYDPNYKLDYDDIRGIQSLYGSQPRTPRPTTKKPRPTTRRPRPATRRPPVTPKPADEDVCTMRFDAIIKAYDGRTYIFRGRNIYRLNSSGYGIEKGYPKPIKDVFMNGPINIGAAVSTRYKTFIFKGKRIWRYTGFRLDYGYPQSTLTGFFSGIQAALEWSDGQIYVFKKNQYSKWTEHHASPPSGYPQARTRFGQGVPINIDAAFKWTDGNTYFFKGDKYFKFDDSTRRVQRIKDKEVAWLGCCNPPK